MIDFPGVRHLGFNPRFDDFAMESARPRVGYQLLRG